MKTKGIVQLALACGIGLVSVAASAADQKSYHAAMCRPWGTWLTGAYPDPFVNESGVQTGNPTTIVCPLIRDQGGSATQIDQAQFEGYNNDGSLSCTLYSQTEDNGGSTLDSVFGSTSTTGAVQVGGFASGMSTTSGEEGSYSFVCDLGSLDSIFHFYVREEPLTD